MSEDIRVEVTCHEGFLVINTVEDKEDKWFVPAGGTRFGCVLIDTEKHLAMSDEAYALLKTMKRGRDAIGDIATWKTDKGHDCFSWIGPTHRLTEVAKCESSRDGIINFKYKKIDNVIPPEALEGIVRTGDEDEE